jgi:hypothetical protein
VAQTAPAFTVTDLTPAGFSATGNSIVIGASAGSVGGFPAGQAQPASHAYLWPDVGNPVDLHPPFMDLADATLTAGGNTFVLSNDSAQQVGYGFGAATYNSSFGQLQIPLRWSGTQASAEVLQYPFQAANGKALGTCGGVAVGYGETTSTVNGRGSIKLIGGPWHAVLWNSGSATAIDLHNGATQTIATACYGTHQVGYGGTFQQLGSFYVYGTIDSKAMMWAGNRSNFIWLHPPSGYATSQALAMNGIYQAGTASVKFRDANGKDAFSNRAVRWSSTPTSMVELQLPAGSLIVTYTASSVTSQGSVAGYGGELQPNGALNLHALYWPDVLTSAIDLNSFLPPGYSNAVASSIDESGRIFGTAVAGGTQRAVMWVPVP